MTKETICVSGGFDPLHIGHLNMFKNAAKHGELIVILNSDEWLVRKKGFSFLPWNERAAIIRELRSVSDIVNVDDSDNTVCEALKRIKPSAFANGGDRQQHSTPEVSLCQKLGIDLLWNIGGKKVNSSSNITRRAWVTRPWGQYTVLDEGKGYKVKKLIIAPGKTTSLQYHDHRNEYWYVAESTATIQLDGQSRHVKAGQPPVMVRQGVHHKLANKDNKPLTLIEIQFGDILNESDIIRLESYSDTPPTA